MDALALIKQARAAGLELSVVEGALRVKGPGRMASLVTLISENKDCVIAALSAVAPVPTASPAASLESFPPPSADADTRTETRGVYHRVSALGFNNEAGAPASGASTGDSPCEIEGAVPRHCEDRCSGLHIQPQSWMCHDGKAYCPVCGKFMGYVRSTE